MISIISMSWTRRLLCCALVALLVAGCSDDSEKPPKSDGPGAADSGFADAARPEPHTFGDYCSDIAYECNTGLICLKEPGEHVGFCSKTCPTQGADCEGAPAGTLARCLWLITTTSQYACQFLCNASGSQPCPVGMYCRDDVRITGDLFMCLPTPQ
jgi:hypothetical protein